MCRKIVGVLAVLALTVFGVASSAAASAPVGTTSRISVASDGTQADGTSYTPAISADGRYITYISDATTLVTGDTNESTDVFLYGLPVAPAAAPPALASTGLNPSVPVNISILLVLTGLGAVAVSIYRRRHAS